MSASNAQAIDGEVNLTNRTGDNSRCWAATVLMQDQTYKILFSCRDITYPGGNEVFYYVVWANPTNGGAAQRLGSLGLGKVQFSTKTEFSSLFITKEKSPNARTPEGPTVMQGTLRTVPILTESGRSTTLTGNATNAPSQTTEPTVTGEPAPTATPQPRTGIAKFLTSGILAFLALFGIIFVVFVITKR